MGFDFLGFGSKSQSSSSTNQDWQIDGRVGMDGEGNTANVSTVTGTGNTTTGAGSNLSQVSVAGANLGTIITTDYGAVSKSLELAFKGVEAANQQAQQALESSSGLLDSVFTAQAATSRQLASAVESVKTSDVRVMGAAALGILGIVVAVAMKKG